jgi:hypothetical protein
VFPGKIIAGFKTLYDRIQQSLPYPVLINHYAARNFDNWQTAIGVGVGVVAAIF